MVPFVAHTFTYLINSVLLLDSKTKKVDYRYTHTHTPLSTVLVGVVARFEAECNGPSLGGEDAGLEVLETLSMG